MRVSGGIARGIPLLVPKTAVRPATDRLRQGVFSSLGARVEGARFLDLFAGSGAYGLEALSRGAHGGVFVEQNARALDCLRSNLAAVCKCLGRTEHGVHILRSDASAAPNPGVAPPDLVFIDPPYELIDTVALPLFSRLAGLLEPRPDALIIFEVPGEKELTPPGWTCVNRLGKRSRQPNALFFVRTSPASP